MLVLGMGYQPRAKSFRSSGRGFSRLRGDKARAERRRRKSINGSNLEEKHASSGEEVSEKTLRQLRNLGNQKFGCSPFSDYFERWLLNLSGILSEFESNPNITVDEQFTNDRSQILSMIEFELSEKRSNEISLEETARSLPSNKQRLREIKYEYSVKAKEIRIRKNKEIKRLYKSIDVLRKELDEIVRMKTGFFRGLSKKDREQKEQRKSHELNAKQTELEMTMMTFSSEQKSLRETYEMKWQPIVGQIRDSQKKIESLETDGSLENRWFACAALADAVNAVLQRKSLQLRQSEKEVRNPSEHKE